MLRSINWTLPCSSASLALCPFLASSRGAMVLSRLFVVVLSAAMAAVLFFSPADAGVVGVNYGTLANNLPDVASVVRLLQRNGIKSVRLYDANAMVLNALANTGITVIVMLPNDNLAAAALDPSNARRWVQRNVAAHYPATRIIAVDVGNEVFLKAKNLTRLLVPAMNNVYAALVRLRLQKAVKVTTPIAFTALKVSWPPSAGRFQDDIARSVMRPLIDFLDRTGSYLGVNAYPFFAYIAQPDKIPLDYALGNYTPGVRDPGTGLVYHSLLDAQIDAAHFAIQRLGSSTSVRGEGNSLAKNGQPQVNVPENGHPNGGRRNGGRRRHLMAAGDEAAAAASAASVANAKAYNNYVINRILSGNTGTPYRPNADLNIHIFSLFNENLKGFGPGDFEQHFGLFYPNQTKVYDFDFRGTHLPPPPPPPPMPSWCVANAAVGDARLQAAMDYACGHGADCGAIQPGARCFSPDTKVAHATYAMNDYYQRNGRASQACDFSGAGSIVYQQPSICDPSQAASWCVARAEVGDARLQAALDWACGHGADCSAIQRGGRCFDPDTKVAHASYAFNDYYQRNGRASSACDFAGAGSIVYQAPKIGNCQLRSKA